MQCRANMSRGHKERCNHVRAREPGFSTDRPYLQAGKFCAQPRRSFGNANSRRMSAEADKSFGMRIYEKCACKSFAMHSYEQYARRCFGGIGARARSSALRLPDGGLGCRGTSPRFSDLWGVSGPRKLLPTDV